MGALCDFERRVLEDLRKHGHVERGAATNQALEVLIARGFVTPPLENGRRGVTESGIVELGFGGETTNG